MAHVCQKCGHTGFQQVMIYCRQCRIACEHKYCLFKFPKKGEKVRWYCEECKPTFFAASSPKTLEVDTGKRKSYPESIQKLQNQEPNSNQKLRNQVPNSNLKPNSPEAFCGPQFEMVQEEAESMKSSKRRKLAISNDGHLDQKAPDTPSNHFPKLTIFNDSHLDQKAPDIPNHFPPLVTSCGDTTMHEVQEEAESMKSSPDLCGNEKSSKRRKLAVSNDGHLDQKAPDTPSNHFPKLTIFKDSHLDQKAPDIPPNHFPPPVTSCGDTTMHEVSPETKNANSQETVVHRPETSVQNIPRTARPFNGFVWRGCISFGNGEFIPFRAHLSCLACTRVFDAAKHLPPILPMDKYSRRDLEQNIFKNGPPTGDGIGLYFFPDMYAKPEHVSRLIDDSMRKDLMFVFTFDELELFIFLSCILPEEHHKFNGQYYLWGGFRKKQLPVTTTSTNHHLEPNKELTENIQDKEVIRSTFTCKQEQRQKPVYEPKMKHAEDKAEAQANLFGSLITEKLKRIIETINEKHTQNNDKNPPNELAVNRRSIEEIRAEYKETKTHENSINTHRRRLWNPQDREKFRASAQIKMHAQHTQKWLPQNSRKAFASRFTDERRRNKDHAHNNPTSRLTPRQRSLYELKKEQNRDGMSHNRRTENKRGLFEPRENVQKNPGGTRISSRIRRKTETNGEDWIAYFEQEDMREKVMSARSKRNRTGNGSSWKANAIEGEEMNNSGDEDDDDDEDEDEDEDEDDDEDEDEDECNKKQKCMEETVKKDEQIAGERSASPNSSTCTEEQKPRGMMEKFVDLEGLEEGEILP